MNTSSETYADYLKRRHAKALLGLRRAFLRHLLTVPGHQGSVDDIRHHVPVDCSPNVLGVVPRGPLRPFLTDMGYRASTNKVNHNRPIKVWRLKEPQQADQWLAAHTEEADDAGYRNTSRPDNGDRGDPVPGSAELLSGAGDSLAG